MIGSAVKNLMAKYGPKAEEAIGKVKAATGISATAKEKRALKVIENRLSKAPDDATKKFLQEKKKRILANMQKRKVGSSAGAGAVVGSMLSDGED